MTARRSRNDHHDANADNPDPVPCHWRNGGPITLVSDNDMAERDEVLPLVSDGDRWRLIDATGRTDPSGGGADTEPAETAPTCLPDRHHRGPHRVGDAQWKYVNVCRLVIFVDEAVEEGTQWVVFEPNDEATRVRCGEPLNLLPGSVAAVR